MKSTFTTLMVALLPLFSFAQQNFERFSLGLGGGITRNSGDLASSSSKSLLTGNADYFLSPYIQTGLELQTGKISAESNSSVYQNSFTSVLWINKIHAGQFMRLREVPIKWRAVMVNTLKGLYTGAGIGATLTSQKNISGVNALQESRKNSSIGAVVPITFGLDNSGFNERFITGIAYQGHFALSDKFDGYASSGTNKDYYSTFVISFKMRLGPLGVY